MLFFQTVPLRLTIQPVMKTLFTIQTRHQQPPLEYPLRVKAFVLQTVLERDPR